jgi:hypothetical protein
MVAQVKELFSSYNLLDKLIAYVEDEGDNLCTLCMNSHLCDQICSYRICNSLARILFLPCFFAKHENMLVMIQMFVRAFMRLV